MGPSILLRVFFFQILVGAIVVYVLKRILDNILIDTALRQFNFLPVEGFLKQKNNIVIRTHRPLKASWRQKTIELKQKKFGSQVDLEFIVDKRLWGGIMIHFADQTIDNSLRDRLRQALER